MPYLYCMATATTTQEIEMTTTQKAPVAIKSINDLAYSVTLGTVMHGYCHASYSLDASHYTITWDVYCQIDGGDEVLIGRNLTSPAATALINQANTATFNGEEV